MHGFYWPLEKDPEEAQIEAKNIEILEKLDRICDSEQSNDVVKSQITSALKEITFPYMLYKSKFSFLGSLLGIGKMPPHSDDLTTLFVMATGERKNKLASFLIKQKMADKKAIISNYGEYAVLAKPVTDTLLHMAVRFNNVDVFVMLKNEGLSERQKNGEGLTSEEVAYKVCTGTTRFMKENLVNCVHSDTPEYNSEAQRLMHNLDDNHLWTFFLFRNNIALLDSLVGKPEKEPAPTRVATQNIQRVPDTARQNVG